MWISRQISRVQEEAPVCKGRVTLNDNGSLEAVSTGIERNLEVFSPYGYSYSIPTGDDMLLAKCDGQQCAVGVKMNNSGLPLGEIMISSSSGACIRLKNDGSVEINGLVIDKSGRIL